MTALTLPAGAEAAFPGSNGKLAFVRAGNIWITNPDGSGMRQMTSSGADLEPTWSADGQRIAFSRNGDVWVMDAGTGAQAPVTTGDATDRKPTWSPDGTRIAFGRGTASPRSAEIFAINADGSGLTNLTNGQAGPAANPDWSPDGQKIAFNAYDINGAGNIYAINADGTGLTQITHYAPGSRSSYHIASRPDWSPDNTRITFEHAYGGASSFYSSVAVVNAAGGIDHNYSCCFDSEPVFSPDGRFLLYNGGGEYSGCGSLCVTSADAPSANPVPVPGTTQGDLEPDWQPRPAGTPTPSGFPHPASASLVRVPLVPAYTPCTFSNTTHGPPLVWGSCSPASPASGYLTVGTPDANGHAANASGWVEYRVLADDPDTTTDEADVRIGLMVTDVRRKSDLSDYAGEIWTLVSQQITDLDNPGPLGDSGTVEEQPMIVTAPCAPTADPTIGSTCQATTTVDTLAPGAILGGDQGIWELNRVEVYDGGSDGDHNTGFNTLFMQQGVYVP